MLRRVATLDAAALPRWPAAKKHVCQTSLRDVHYIPSYAPWVETHGYHRMSLRDGGKSIEFDVTMRMPESNEGPAIHRP